MNVIRLIDSINKRGIAGTIRWSLLYVRHFFLNRSELFPKTTDNLRGKSGIEIGGPSQVFASKGIFPVYSIAGHLDNCNFGSVTVWEGHIDEGYTFEFDRRKPKGQQFIAEATDMKAISSGSYDFVLSSHVLEHTANPILALMEWIRVLKDDGVLVLILPHKDGTFDHRRPVTTLSHMQEDYDAGVGEDDMTHLPEILALHDFNLDPQAGGMENFKKRSLRNFENRCLHHHVFDTKSAVELVDHMGLQLVGIEPVYPMHVVIVAKKNGQGDGVNNQSIMTALSNILRRSPFQSDKALQSKLHMHKVSPSSWA